MQALIDFFRSIDWVLNLGGVVAYITSAYFLVRERQRFRELRRLKEEQPGAGNIGVAIGVGVSVAEEARRFLQESFGNGPEGKPVVPLLVKYEKLGFFSNDEIVAIMREIRDELRKLQQVGGVREVHLFYGGPVGVAAALGAIVDNWVPVRWYVRNRQGDYEHLFTLDIETVKGL